ncbi:hypothetical protein MKW98_000999 [Papaver atlanticum]|uniref:Uncharacterized protein n=1 Tax=Papaver atlanticum TaxID=357466 RepID=A0AAD4SDM8_9MAGN|nr:hypothetical protein MKW98_000999 [Papaver atlanticum]
MASSNKTFHARTISLPTTSYPLTLVVEEPLCRLRSSELATSSSSISNNLARIKDLYESVEDFLWTHDAKCLDTVLDGSIMLLDVCSTIKDLQSSIRRCSNEVDTYMTSRKKVAKNRSLIFKLMSAKGEAQQISKVMKFDIALKSKQVEVKDIQKPLKAVEMNLQDLEDGLESVFRKPTGTDSYGYQLPDMDTHFKMHLKALEIPISGDIEPNPPSPTSSSAFYTTTIKSALTSVWQWSLLKVEEFRKKNWKHG